MTLTCGSRRPGRTVAIRPVRGTPASTTSTTRSWSGSVISWNSGRINDVRVSRSVTGRPRPATSA